MPATEPPINMSKAESFARLMDKSIRLPGGFKIGLDGIIGLVPGVGDATTGLLSLWLLQQAHKEGLPKNALFRMGGNIVVDTTLGAVPIVGDVFDFFWKANVRNLRIMEKHREKLARAEAKTKGKAGETVEVRPVVSPNTPPVTDHQTR